MALRHRVPDFIVRDMERLEEPTRVPPVMRMPVTVGFRNGADLNVVVQTVIGNKVTAIDAAVGSGKTVKVPAELARATSMLVIHSFPSTLLAYATHEYVARNTPISTCYIADCDQEFPNRGIVFTSNAVLVGRLLASGSISSVPVILYMDEVHESDTYTYVMRTLAPSLPEVKALVMATATASPAGGRRRETDGEYEEHVYGSSLTPRLWDVFEPGKPWSVSKLRGNAVLFVDSKDESRRLANDYRDAGLDAFVWTSDMPLQQFALGLNKMFDTSGTIVVAIADYSFRSGFTLPVETIVDSGIVGYIINDKGTPTKVWRRAFGIERYQAQGRGGRLAGMNCVCYSPDDEPANAICDLEGVEMDAAVVIFRMLGYKPPVALRGSAMCDALVPKDLCTVLQGAQPFGCLPDSILAPLASLSCKPRPQSFQAAMMGVPMSVTGLTGVDPVSPTDSVSQAGYGARVGIAQGRYVPKSYRADSVTETIECHTPQVARSAVPIAPLGMTHMQDIWDGMPALQAMSESVRDTPGLELGRYYIVPQVSEAPQRSAAFPDGVASVKRFLDKPNVKLRLDSLCRADRLFAVSSVLSVYNLATAEYLALRRIAADAPAQHTSSVAVQAIVRDWCVGIMEAVSDKVSDIRICATAFQAFGLDALEEMPPLIELETNFARAHMARLSDALTDVASDYKQSYHAALLGSGGARAALMGAAQGGAFTKAVVTSLEDGQLAFGRANRMIEAPPLPEKRDRRSVAGSGTSGRQRREYVVRPADDVGSLWSYVIGKISNAGGFTVERVEGRRRRSSASRH